MVALHLSETAIENHDISSIKYIQILFNINQCLLCIQMDKATILEDAIKHLKQLNERVKTLEEHVADKKVESAVFMKRSILFEEDDRSSCDENSDQSLSKIEARVSGKDMLIRIHGDKHCGRTATAILNELEKHHLSVQSSSILPFGNNYLDITIVAQVKFIQI